MSINYWGKYKQDMFYLFYPESQEFSLANITNATSRRHWSRCNRRCPPPVPPTSRQFSIASLYHEPPTEEDKAEAYKGNEEDNITDLVIPMSFYLCNLVEPTRVLSSTSHIPYSKHYPLYHFKSNHLVHLK
ncbi:hypothetical protein [Coleofasciculus sp.]|uniref:hypothetical protein n=1 Tax=Coleofasciculus sp. TaxID=3100458 RepID=UPI0039FAFC1F